MSFKLDRLIPAPLADQLKPDSEIWNKEVELISGTFIQVKAPSGKGKSTFIQSLYGNRKDYAGKVFFHSKDIRSHSSGKWAEVRQKQLSIVFQELLLFSELTGWENLLVKSKLTDFYKKERILQMADELGITQLMGKNCGLMSFGERQRFAIVRSLLQPFEWLLLDEPFSHLDGENTRKACELIIKECSGRNAGLIITSLDGDRFIDFNSSLIL